MIEFLITFEVTFCADVVWAAYIQYVNDKKAVKAALASALIVLLGGAVTLTIVDNPLNLIAAVVGAYLGTWLVVQ